MLHSLGFIIKAEGNAYQGQGNLHSDYCTDIWLHIVGDSHEACVWEAELEAQSADVLCARELHLKTTDRRCHSKILVNGKYNNAIMYDMKDITKTF